MDDLKSYVRLPSGQLLRPSVHVALRLLSPVLYERAYAPMRRHSAPDPEALQEVLRLARESAARDPPL